MPNSAGKITGNGTEVNPPKNPFWKSEIFKVMITPTILIVAGLIGWFALNITTANELKELKQDMLRETDRIHKDVENLREDVRMLINRGLNSD
ncbi:MAG: hypothetical protein F4X69_02635 [Gemmatimonadetes bacterium]|nr:hypothetical protein [Gemmatimonadota bacterium]